MHCRSLRRPPMASTTCSRGNVAHSAHAQYRPRIERGCLAHGYEPPVLCTPEELTGPAGVQADGSVDTNSGYTDGRR
jgi:hypothetical protein